MGTYLRRNLKIDDYEIVKDIRGKGLLNGIEFYNAKDAEDFVELLLEERILTKITRERVVRITPPLTINKKQIYNLINKIKISLDKI